MILYRPVGLQELALIYDSGMKAFPARLPQQPIFYPVLELEYARQTASNWNAKNGQFAGYVTQFKVEEDYISQFEKHKVGGSQHQEFWIPAEEVEEFNKHITGHIKILEAHFGDAYQGFVPETFGMQGKNAVAQFTLLANSYLYNRMDFYLEIKRNHKAVFLNYPFWQTHDFKNPGLKEKVIKAIKEAWLTSFPKIPLPVPPPETPLEKQTDSHAEPLEKPVREDLASVEQANSRSLVTPAHEDTPFVKKKDSPAQHLVSPVHKDIKPLKPADAPAYTLLPPADEEMTLEEELDSNSLVNPVDEDPTLEEETDSNSWENDVDEDMAPAEETDSRSLVKPVHEEITPVKQTASESVVSRMHENATLPRQTESHVAQGIKLGLNGKDREAIDEFSRAVEEDPDHVIAHTSLGVAFHRLGEDDRALACYETALKIDPNYAEAHYFRANILYRHGDVREAIAGYTIAIGLKPELIEAHREPTPQDRLTDYSSVPAEMYWIAKPARRILDLNKLFESNPGGANLFKDRAAHYYRLWNYEQAVADYSSSLAIWPDDASALHARGVAYEQLGQFDRAREDYQNAIAVNPRLSDAYLDRGVALGKTGNFRQSIVSLSEGIRLAPENPNGYFNRGTSYFQLGDFENAIADFSMVIQLFPKDEAAYYWRGLSNEEAGRQGEAIADYRQFLALSQDENARAEIQQKLSQWNAGKRDRAIIQSAVPDDRQKTNPVPPQKPDQDLDLYGLIVALGERALNSTWFGSGVECYGEKAEELYAFTDQGRPIEGRDLLRIASGIRQTIEGDFQAFDPGAASPWVFIRAWEGNGFYVETDDPTSKEHLRAHFQSVEEVDGASPPYEGLFIRT